MNVDEADQRSRKMLGFLVEVAYYTGLIRILNFLVNRFELNRVKNTVRFPFMARRQNHGVQILLYHRVSDTRDPFLPSLSVSTFRTHMECLAEHFDVWRLEDAVEALVRRDLPPDVVVITLDDGYRDNFLHAYPLLKDLTLPATIFLATGVVGTDTILWHDRVFRAFDLTMAPCLTSFGPSSLTLPLGTAEEKDRARSVVLKFLRLLDEPARSRWIDELTDRLQVTEERPTPRLMLDWDEVRQMSRQGVSFGAHTVSHPILSSLSPERARQEITESKAEIERQLGLPVNTFAYPNGSAADFNETTKSAVRDAGFSCAVTTVFGANYPADDERRCDLMELKRGGSWDHRRAAFATRMNIHKLA